MNETIREAMSHRGLIEYTPEDIDPEIYELIKKLNESGFRTYGSCAGHLGLEDKGYVAFRDELTPKAKKQIQVIFKDYGITELEFIGSNSIYFKAIGKGIPQETELWWKTVDELRAMCKRRNLPIGGRKGELIWRLLGLKK